MEGPGAPNGVGPLPHMASAFCCEEDKWLGYQLFQVSSSQTSSFSLRKQNAVNKRNLQTYRVHSPDGPNIIVAVTNAVIFFQ